MDMGTQSVRASRSAWRRQPSPRVWAMTTMTAPGAAATAARSLTIGQIWDVVIAIAGIRIMDGCHDEDHQADLEALTSGPRVLLRHPRPDQVHWHGKAGAVHQQVSQPDPGARRSLV